MAPDSTPQKQVPKAEFRLPAQIVTRADVSRLAREVESLQEFFAQAAVSGASAKAVPAASIMLRLLIEENGLNVLHEPDRQGLQKFLDTLCAKAPVVHASFAVDPKPEFLTKLVAWFRAEAHPFVLLQIGLQPNLAAGCIIRTTNKYFDFSFRRHFKENKPKLSDALRSPA